MLHFKTKRYKHCLQNFSSMQLPFRQGEIKSLSISAGTEASSTLFLLQQKAHYKIHETSILRKVSTNYSKTKVKHR